MKVLLVARKCLVEMLREWQLLAPVILKWFTASQGRSSGALCNSAALSVSPTEKRDQPRSACRRD